MSVQNNKFQHLNFSKLKAQINVATIVKKISQSAKETRSVVLTLEEKRNLISVIRFLVENPSLSKTQKHYLNMQYRFLTQLNGNSVTYEFSRYTQPIFQKLASNKDDVCENKNNVNSSPRLPHKRLQPSKDKHHPKRQKTEDVRPPRSGSNPNYPKPHQTTEDVRPPRSGSASDYLNHIKDVRM